MLYSVVMTSHFTADFFARNRASLRQAVGSDVPIVITANGNMQRSADATFRFIQDSNFWYLTGVNAADLVLVMTAAETYLIAPDLSPEKQIFDGAYDLAAITARSGVTDIVDEQTGWQRLADALQPAHQVATLGANPSYITRHRLHSLPYRRRLIAKLRRLDRAVHIQDIRPLLVTLRCTKQPPELLALQQAIDITAATLQDVAKPTVLQTAQHEYELEAAIGYGFRRRGAEGHAFDPIVGAGADGTTLHHVDNNGPIATHDMIVLDVGASVEHYTADITRTVCKQPFSQRQADVFQAVATVQDYALGLLRPGVLLKDYEAAVATCMSEQLQRLGLIKTTTADQIRRYFPHATSHFLGLDVHDVGDYQQPLAANMVVTCEPGIYIPEEGIGVRIEDDVLITETGNRVLSAACPRLLTAVQ